VICNYCWTPTSPWSCSCGLTRLGGVVDVEEVIALGLEVDQTMVEAALALVAVGWAVFPLDGKRPFPRTRGFHDATTDSDVVRWMWSVAPRANIGSPVPSKLIVLDIDPRNGGDFAALGPLPPTLTCWSGRNDGGRHLYFRRPAVETFTSSRLPDGIDLKTTGYMCMAPSIHPDTGQPYRWEHHPVAPLPERLVELIRHRSRPKTVATAPTGDGNGLVAHVARQGEGNRNQALYWAARTAADDGLLDRIAEDLIAAAVTAGETEYAARSTVESARRKASHA
jgi:hypothetical protein